jgi:hypothetical protein
VLSEVEQMKSVFEVATELAEAHRAEDPATDAIYLSAAEGEVRLVEVSKSVGSSARGEVLPFGFRARPEQGIPYPSVIVLLSPSEWSEVKSGALTLPRGWNRDELKKIA